MLSIGLMSGTSMDGIDAVLLETDGTEKLINYLTEISIHYNSHSQILFKSAEFAVRQMRGDLNQTRAHFPLLFRDYVSQLFTLDATGTQNKLDELTVWLHGAGQTHRLITFDEIVQHSTLLHLHTIQSLLRKVDLSTHKIDVIGYHGQTLLHAPHEKISVIVGDGQRLADELGVVVVNDFRRADIEAGGQGAPFAPLYHQALAVNSKQSPLAVVNCGGIANVTFVSDADPLNLIAFDTGPGNALIDRFVQKHTKGVERMDTNGSYAMSGKVIPNILKILYEKSISKNYFSQLPPKSLDVNDLVLIPELETISIENACRTLAAFTADTIVKSISCAKILPPSRWVLAGGGWHNEAIRFEFKKRLEEHLNVSPAIMSADEMGWKNQSLEAQIFAWLAVRSLKKLPLSVPNTTGVSHPMTGGKLNLPMK